MKFLLSVAHLRMVPNLYEFLSSVHTGLEPFEDELITEISFLGELSL